MGHNQPTGLERALIAFRRTPQSHVLPVLLTQGPTAVGRAGALFKCVIILCPPYVGAHASI